MRPSVGSKYYIVFGQSPKSKFVAEIKEFPSKHWQAAVKFAFKLKKLKYTQISIREYTATNIMSLVD